MPDTFQSDAPRFHTVRERASADAMARRFTADAYHVRLEGESSDQVIHARNLTKI